MLQQCGQCPLTWGHILPLFHVPFIALAKNLHNIEPKHTLSFICSSLVHLGPCHAEAHPPKHKVEQGWLSQGTYGFSALSLHGFWWVLSTPTCKTHACTLNLNTGASDSKWFQDTGSFHLHMKSDWTKMHMKILKHPKKTSPCEKSQPRHTGLGFGCTCLRSILEWEHDPKRHWQKNMDEPQANSMTSPCEKSQTRHTGMWFSFWSGSILGTDKRIWKSLKLIFPNG